MENVEFKMWLSKEYKGLAGLVLLNVRTPHWLEKIVFKNLKMNRGVDFGGHRYV